MKLTTEVKKLILKAIKNNNTDELVSYMRKVNIASVTKSTVWTRCGAVAVRTTDKSIVVQVGSKFRTFSDETFTAVKLNTLKTIALVIGAFNHSVTVLRQLLESQLSTSGLTF